MEKTTTLRDLRAIADYNRFCELVRATTAIPKGEEGASQSGRIARARKDYNFFVRTYFEAYADADCGSFQIQAANAILADPNIMAILEWPREHAKSVHATIIIPMWLMANGELTGMLLMSKNADAACNLLSDIQAQLQFNQLFIHDFGNQYKFGDWQEGDFTTSSGVRFLSVGRGQSVRGARKGEKRPNYGVIDDVDDDEIVHNGKRVRQIVENIMGGFYFALSIKGARMVVAGNRIHRASILAHLVGDTKQGSPKREGIFHSLVLATTDGTFTGPPSWPERYTSEELLRKIQKAGPTLARKEFFHDNRIEGGIFKEAYFQWTKMEPAAQQLIIGYFDPSFVNNATSDYKAIRVWGLEGEHLNLLKSFVRRCDLVQAFVWMAEYERSLPTGTGIIWYIERQFITSIIYDALEQAKKIANYEINVIQDNRQKEEKFTRMVRMEPYYSLRKVYFNIDEQHNADMIEGNNQLSGIEPGYRTPDDAPDADEGAWWHLLRHVRAQAFAPIFGGKKQSGW